ncbi:9226_t:CDS:2 [Scutellospora calospora]|uniref:9226_t:CDS:1 n=1 Tax=Scutellospora calospora TaxID=85575 RepID=A0ACA9MM07_9GLOM|nr:9226_t:CDS:2 [Scutellospora calospora]
MEIDSVDNYYSFARGWALKENQTLGGKGGDKRIKQQDKLTAQGMYDKLQEEFKEKVTEQAQKALEETRVEYST